MLVERFVVRLRDWSPMNPSKPPPCRTGSSQSGTSSSRVQAGARGPRRPPSRRVGGRPWPACSCVRRRLRRPWGRGAPGAALHHRALPLRPRPPCRCGCRGATPPPTRPRSTHRSPGPPRQRGAQRGGRTRHGTQAAAPPLEGRRRHQHRPRAGWWRRCAPPVAGRPASATTSPASPNTCRVVTGHQRRRQRRAGRRPPGLGHRRQSLPQRRHLGEVAGRHRPPLGERAQRLGRRLPYLAPPRPQPARHLTLVDADREHEVPTSRTPPSSK